MAAGLPICYYHLALRFPTIFPPSLEGESLMVRTTVGRLVCWTTLVSLAVVFATVEQPVLRGWPGEKGDGEARPPPAEVLRSSRHDGRTTAKRSKKSKTSMIRRSPTLEAQAQGPKKGTRTRKSPPSLPRTEEANRRREGQGPEETGQASPAKPEAGSRPSRKRKPRRPLRLSQNPQSSGANAATPPGCALPPRG